MFGFISSLFRRNLRTTALVFYADNTVRNDLIDISDCPEWIQASKLLTKEFIIGRLSADKLGLRPADFITKIVIIKETDEGYYQFLTEGDPEQSIHKGPQTVKCWYTYEQPVSKKTKKPSRRK